MDLAQTRATKLTGQLRLTVLYLPLKVSEDWIHGIQVTLCPKKVPHPPLIPMDYSQITEPLSNN